MPANLFNKLQKELSLETKEAIRVKGAFALLVFLVILQLLYFFFIPSSYKYTQYKHALAYLLLGPTKYLDYQSTNKGPEYDMAKQLDRDLPDKSRILFVNDQANAGLEMISYHQIQTYMDTPHLTMFEHDPCPDEGKIVQLLKKDKMDYLVTFKNPKLDYNNCSLLRDKSGVFRLENDKLTLVREYGNN